MRPYVLTIAGFDPSNGAGLTADVKTFEMNGTYGLSVCTAITMQTDQEFIAVNWLSANEIMNQLTPLINRFEITVCKVGLINNWEVLQQVIDSLKDKIPEVKIVLDPILKASAGFEFHQSGFSESTIQLLTNIDLITPNYKEAMQLAQGQNIEDTCLNMSQYCAVLLKGGHNPNELGVDYLYEKQGAIIKILPSRTDVKEKHGSGCVLSAAISAQLALGNDLVEACRLGKVYTERFLGSNSTLLGYHYHDC